MTWFLVSVYYWVFPGVERQPAADQGPSRDKGGGAGGVQAAERRAGDEAGYRAGDGCGSQK